MNSKIAVKGRGKVGIKQYSNKVQSTANTNKDSKYSNTKSDNNKGKSMRSLIMG